MVSMLRILLLGILFTISSFCQYDTASVLGTVTDPTDAAVVGARVTLENARTGVRLTATTDANGGYIFQNQRIGEYRVVAEHQGFKQVASLHFTLTVNARQRVDLRLQVGEVTQTIEVSGAAQVLEADSSDRGQVINRAAIINLPLNGRAYADLTLLSPGVRKSNITNRDA
jgi:hypothetical protein